MGGIGKTTLAEATYNRLFHDFGRQCCAHVTFEIGAEGNTDFIKQCSNALQQLGETIGISDINGTLGKLKNVLQSKKVLLLFDNVDSHFHARSLMDCCEGVAMGSRILFTGRNKISFGRLPEDAQLSVGILSEEAAFELLCCKAELSGPLAADLEDAVKMAAGACGYLPLALELLGCYMLSKKLEDQPHMWQVRNAKTYSQ